MDQLSLGINGNDHHVIAALEKVDARIAIVEYNAKFPLLGKFVTKYAPCTALCEAAAWRR